MSLAQHAKELRKKSTPVERVLWKALRAKRFETLKFKRQQPIGKYIVDFICFEKRLIIECDGGQHSFQEQQDRQRDEWLEKEGFRVLRFWNHEVLKNLKTVLQVIFDVCRDCVISPSPRPSPARGEGDRRSYLREFLKED